MLLIQELKGTEFPSVWFKEQGYDSVSVTQKTYNGVAISVARVFPAIAGSRIRLESIQIPSAAAAGFSNQARNSL